jgi:hypothetical protein
MTGDESNPLSGRTCGYRLGNYPDNCIFEKCSRFEVCCYDIAAAALELDRVRRHPSHMRIKRGESWGNR